MIKIYRIASGMPKSVMMGNTAAMLAFNGKQTTFF
jgi:hypothetical protein